MEKLIVISAPSGGGKTSLIEALIRDLTNIEVKLAISYTTRKRRPNEKEGQSYFFVNKKEFSLMLENKELLESAEIYGYLYGTKKSWVEEQISNNCYVILELDWQGALQVKTSYPNSVTIFILPPSYKELELRLKKRGQDRKKVIQYRLSEAKREVEKGQNFDFVLVNDVFENVLKDLKTIIIEGGNLPKVRRSLTKECLRRLLV